MREDFAFSVAVHVELLEAAAKRDNGALVIISCSPVLLGQCDLVSCGWDVSLLAENSWSFLVTAADKDERGVCDWTGFCVVAAAFESDDALGAVDALSVVVETSISFSSSESGFGVLCNSFAWGSSDLIGCMR